MTETSRPHAQCNSKRGLPLNFDITPQTTLAKAEDSKKFGPCKVTTLDAQTAIILLKSTEKHVVLEALQSLQKFCRKCPENREIFIGLKGVPAVFTLIGSQHRVTQRLAMKILAMTSYFEESKVFIRDHDGAQELMNIGLYSDDDVLVEYATVVLADLATNPACGLLMIKFSAFEVLIDIAMRKDPDIQHNALVAVRNLLEETLHVHILLEQASLRRILDLVDSKHTEVKLFALSILEKVSRVREGIEILGKPGMIQTVGNKLKKKHNDDINHLILRIWHNLSKDSECCLQMLEYYYQLSYFLDYGSEPKVLAQTVKIFGNMCREPEIAEILVDNTGLTAKVAKLLSHTELGVREAALDALIQLSFVVPNIKLTIAHELHVLISIANASETSAHGLENLLYVLGLLLPPPSGDHYAVMEVIISEFVEKGGMKILRKIIADQEQYSENIVISALNLMNRLINKPDLALRAVQEGVMQGAIKCLNSKGAELFAAACTTLSLLMTDDYGRNQFMHNKWWRNVLRAIKFPEHGAAMAVVPLLDVLVSYVPVAQKLVDAGLIQVILEREDFRVEGGPFQTLLERVIQFHLPAKYALTGHLDWWDPLPNGFYDAGYMSNEEVFIPLRERTYNAQHMPKMIYLNLDYIVDEKVLRRNGSIQALPRTVDVLPVLQQYAVEIQKQIDELGTNKIMNERQLIRLIGNFVANKFGGPIDKWRVDSVLENTVIGDLQKQYQSVAIPLTMLTEGTHRPRALLFKALADMLGISATLDRGSSRTWNIVYLRSTKRRVYHRRPGNEDNVEFRCSQGCKDLPEIVEEPEEEENEEVKPDTKEIKEEPISTDKKAVTFPVPKEALKTRQKPGKKQRNVRSEATMSLTSEQPSKNVGFGDKARKRKGSQERRTDSKTRADQKADPKSKKHPDQKADKAKKHPPDQKGDTKPKNPVPKKPTVKHADDEKKGQFKAKDGTELGSETGSNETLSARMDGEEEDETSEPLVNDQTGADRQKSLKQSPPEQKVTGFKSKRDEKKSRANLKGKLGKKSRKRLVAKKSIRAVETSSKKNPRKVARKSISTTSLDSVILFDDDPGLPDCIFGKNVDLIYAMSPGALPEEHGEGYEEEIDLRTKLSPDLGQEEEQGDDAEEAGEDGEAYFYGIRAIDGNMVKIPVEWYSFPEITPYVVWDEKDKRKYMYSEKIRPFVVDLMFEPGELFELHSQDAHIYTGQ